MWIAFHGWLSFADSIKSRAMVHPPKQSWSLAPVAATAMAVVTPISSPPGAGAVQLAKHSVAHGVLFMVWGSLPWPTRGWRMVAHTEKAKLTPSEGIVDTVEADGLPCAREMQAVV